MSKIYADRLLKLDRVNVALTSATTSPNFTAGAQTLVYYTGTNVGTLQCTLDGTTWVDVGTSTAKSNASVITNDVFLPYVALAARAGAFRVSFATAFTGTFIVEANL